MVCLIDLDRARKLMDESDIDVVIASSRDNFGYLTGYWDHYGKYFETGWIGDPFLTLAGIFREKDVEPFMIVESVLGRDIEYINPWIKDRVIYSAPEYAAHRGVKYESDPYKCLSDLLKQRNLTKSRIGIELNHKSYTNELFPAKAIDKLQSLLPQAELLDGSNILCEMRLLKTSEELRLIKKSTEIISRAIKDSFTQVSTGMTEQDFEMNVRRNLIDKKVSTALINVHFGDGDFLRPTQRKLEKNETIRLDLASIYEGYYGDVSRTYIHGEPTKKVSDIFQIVKKGVEMAFETISLGVNCSEIYQAVYDSMKNTEYPLGPPIIGHGVGICVHEAPYLMNNNMVIQPNMAFTVEVIRRTPNVGWIGLEDTLITDKNGCHNITDLDLKFNTC